MPTSVDAEQLPSERRRDAAELQASAEPLRPDVVIGSREVRTADRLTPHEEVLQHRRAADQRRPGPAHPRLVNVNEALFSQRLIYYEKLISKGLFDYRIRIRIRSKSGSDSLGKSNDLGVSNVSRIHFGFEFIVNPDPDPIIK